MDDKKIKQLINEYFKKENQIEDNDEVKSIFKNNEGVEELRSEIKNNQKNEENDQEDFLLFKSLKRLKDKKLKNQSQSKITSKDVNEIKNYFDSAIREGFFF